jgi:transcriptional regulator with XRE-family HTH domain
MNKRINQVRKESGLNQVDFGKRIGISGGAVSMLESGGNNPSEQTIRLICREFQINYEWLVFGEGPMRVPDEYLARAKVEHILSGDNEFVKQVFLELANLSDEAWVEIDDMIDRLHAKRHKKTGR